MKIALQFGMPELQQVQLLIQAANENTNFVDRVEKDDWMHADIHSIIAAYDLNKLVGIATRVQPSTEHTLASAVYYVMDPSYAERGIQSNMMKLLFMNQSTLVSRNKHVSDLA
jgi:hypothetical protein